MFRILGPKGHLIVKSATAARVKAILPALKRRFGKIRVINLNPLSKRDKVVHWAKWGVSFEPSIHYSEAVDRDDWLTKRAGLLPLVTDCSGFATACYKWAGADDPNGLGYKQLGYTGTLLSHMKVVSRPKPGDLVVYGPGTGHHVGIVVEAGSDPLTVSHGQERGPLYIRVSEERRYQPAGIRYLRSLS